MDKDELNYIRDWARSGNEPRVWPLGCPLDACAWEPSPNDSGMPGFYILNPAGLAIAVLAEENERLRAAFEQACETADDLYCAWAFGDKFDPDRRARIIEHRDELCRVTGTEAVEVEP